MSTTAQKRNQELRASLDKVFRVLETVALRPEGVSLKQLSEETGINHSTLSRIGANLVNFGYLKKLNYRTLAADVGLAHLGSSGAAVRIPAHIAQLLADASERTGLEAGVAKLHRSHVVFIMPGTEQSETVEIGSAPLVYSAAGTVLVAAAGLRAPEIKGLLKDLLPILDEESSVKELETELKTQIAAISKEGVSVAEEDGVVEVAAAFDWNGKAHAVVLQGQKSSASRGKDLAAECAALRDGITQALTVPLE